MSYELDCGSCNNGQVCVYLPDYPDPGTYKLCPKCKGTLKVQVSREYVEKLKRQYIKDMIEAENEVIEFRLRINELNKLLEN